MGTLEFYVNYEIKYSFSLKGVTVHTNELNHLFDFAQIGIFTDQFFRRQTLMTVRPELTEEYATRDVSFVRLGSGSWFCSTI